MLNHPLDHASRSSSLAELHARPAPRLRVPSRVVHLALKEGRRAANRDRARDVAQLHQLIGPEGSVVDNHLVFERLGYQVTWENHTEYAAYTAVWHARDEEPFAAQTDALFPADWIDSGPARRIAAVIVELLPMPADREEIPHLVSQWLAQDTTIIVETLGGDGVLAGDFTTDEQGFTRWCVFAEPPVGPGRLGRTAQRLCDIETYRALAMIGYERARDLNVRLGDLDPRLVDLALEVEDESRAAEGVLHDLLSVAAELESLAIAHEFRFGATAAYHQIVLDRLGSLAEDRFRGRQTIAEFLQRRYLPAMRTTTSAQERLTRMLNRAHRAGELLRTRVEVARTEQSQALLQSMDARADLQLRLQHTVEGLSVVAISYYLIGLLGYLIAPLMHHVHIDQVDKVVVMSALVPLVVLGVWLGMRRVRARLERH